LQPHDIIDVPENTECGKIKNHFDQKSWRSRKIRPDKFSIGSDFVLKALEGARFDPEKVHAESLFF
jgi:hypothetical protein